MKWKKKKDGIYIGEITPIYISSYLFFPLKKPIQGSVANVLTGDSYIIGCLHTYSLQIFMD